MYEELVKNLRVCSRCDFGQDCNGCTQNSDDAFCCDKLLHQAADAIEQLSADLERSKEWAGFWQEEAGEALKKFQTTVAKIPRWIPVTERLPEPETDVLSFRIYGSFSQISEVTINDMKKSGEWCYEGVVYWMPLPEPPKEE